MSESHSGLHAALRSAVEANGSGANGNGMSNDLMGLAIKVLPKLLESSEQREALADQQKDGFATMRKELLMLRRQLRDMLQAQALMLDELQRVRKQQAHMVAHLARVQIMEVPEIDAEQDELDDEDELMQELSQQVRRRRR